MTTHRTFPLPFDPAWRLDKDRADGLLQRTYEVAQITRERWTLAPVPATAGNASQAAAALRRGPSGRLGRCQNAAYVLPDSSRETLRQVADYDD
jgi:hypothetical protein